MWALSICSEDVRTDGLTSHRNLLLLLRTISAGAQHGGGGRGAGQGAGPARPPSRPQEQKRERVGRRRKRKEDEASCASSNSHCTGSGCSYGGACSSEAPHPQPQQQPQCCCTCPADAGGGYASPFTAAGGSLSRPDRHLDVPSSWLDRQCQGNGTKRLDSLSISGRPWTLPVHQPNGGRSRRRCNAHGRLIGRPQAMHCQPMMWVLRRCTASLLQ